MSNKLFLFVFSLFLALAVKTQTIEKKQSPEDTAKLREEAVEFLRESVTDVGNLRTLENRVSFASEMAGLMWFCDEREAKTMFATVISDFGQLIASYDSQLNALGGTEEGDDYYGGMSILMPNRSERSRIVGDISKAMNLRQQIALAIAEHDPQFAFDFVDDTALIITNPVARKQLSGRDASIEARLLKEIAEKDSAKALEKAKKSLSRGFNPEFGEVLKKIYAKDPEKGAEFAEDIVSRLKSEPRNSLSAPHLKLVLEIGSANIDQLRKTKGKRPMFRDQSLREIADLLAQAVLSGKKGEVYDIESSIALIERFAPARAVQVRAKLTPKNVKTAAAVQLSTVAPPPPVAVRGTGQGTGSGTDIGLGSNTSNDTEGALENLAELRKKELPSDERAKIVQRSRKMIAGMKTREEKLMAMNMLAAQVADVGDKDLAIEIMTDAQGLVNPSPKTYLDFMHSWMLASGYAKIAPERAFPVLDETILRFNDTLSGFVKVAEFVDVNGEIIEEGEIQLGALGGEMTGQAIKMLGAADTTLIALAKADFARTRALTNRFDRTEVRILAKLLVLRSILGSKKPIEDPFQTVSDPGTAPADENELGKTRP